MLKLRTIRQRLRFAGDLPAGVKVIGWIGLFLGCSSFLFDLVGGTIFVTVSKWKAFPNPFGAPWPWGLGTAGGLWAAASFGLLRGRKWGRKLAWISLLLFAVQVVAGAVMFVVALRQSRPSLANWVLVVIYCATLSVGVLGPAAAMGYLSNPRVRNAFERR